MKHQEWRARQAVNWTAVMQTAFFVGGITFVMSGGSPWSTGGTMNAIIGRDVPWSLPLVLFGHFVASFLLSAVIALCVYRLHLIPALIVGAFVGLGLSWVSREIFENLGWIMQSPEIRARMTHFAFGLFGAAVYKGASVPPPQANDDDPVEEDDHGPGWKMRRN